MAVVIVIACGGATTQAAADKKYTYSTYKAESLRKFLAQAQTKAAGDKSKSVLLKKSDPDLKNWFAANAKQSKAGSRAGLLEWCGWVLRLVLICPEPLNENEISHETEFPPKCEQKEEEVYICVNPNATD
jgi:hypothetical protein